MENQSTDADTYFDWRAIFVSQSKPLRFGEAPGLAAGRGRVVFDLADEVFEAGSGRAWHAKPMSAAWVERALAEAAAAAEEEEEATGLVGVGEP